MSLDSFKTFVKSNPSLINYVRNKEMSWQDFYEMFSLYGGENHVWDKYLGITNVGNSSIKNIFSYLKNIDMNELQKGINSLQKGIGYVQDFLATKTNTPNMRDDSKKSDYEPRPLYKYFDD